MKILHLTLKKKWFDMIASGEKKEEYREIGPYWGIRFCGGEWYNFEIEVLHNKISLHPEAVKFVNGYRPNSPSFLIECKGIVVDTGKTEWGAVPGQEYFVIKLGKIITDQPAQECDASKDAGGTEAGNKNTI
jgi:hypothetical protein